MAAADQFKIELIVDAKGAVSGVRVFDRATKKAGESAKQAEQRIDKLNREMAQAGRIAKASKIGLLAAAAGMAVFAAAALKGVSAALKFENAMSEVSTLLSGDNIAQQTALLTDEVRRLSIEFAQSPIDQAQALYQVISAGATTAAEAIGILTVANKLAVGGVTDVATAADGLTSILNSYGLEAENATRVSDIMFTTMRLGKTTIEELSRFIGTIGFVAAETGIQLEELFAATAALTKGGLQTNRTFAGLRAAISNILKPSTEAKELAKEMGIEFSVAALKAEGLAAFMQKIAAAAEGDTQKLATLFGSIEGVAVVMGLAGSAADDFAEALVEIRNSAGATEAAVALVTSTTDFLVKQIKAKFADQLISLGNTILRVILPALQFMNDNFEKIIKTSLLLAVALVTRLTVGMATMAAQALRTTGSMLVLKAAMGNLTSIAISVGLILITWLITLKDVQEKAKELGFEIDALASSFRELGNAQQTVALRDAQENLEDMRRSAAKLEDQIQALSDKEDRSRVLREEMGVATQVLIEAETRFAIKLQNLEADLESVNTQIVLSLPSIEDMEQAYTGAAGAVSEVLVAFNNLTEFGKTLALQAETEALALLAEEAERLKKQIEFVLEAQIRSTDAFNSGEKVTLTLKNRMRNLWQSLVDLRSSYKDVNEEIAKAAPITDALAGATRLLTIETVKLGEEYDPNKLNFLEVGIEIFSLIGLTDQLRQIMAKAAIAAAEGGNALKDLVTPIVAVVDAYNPLVGKIRQLIKDEEELITTLALGSTALGLIGLSTEDVETSLISLRLELAKVKAEFELVNSGATRTADTLERMRGAWNLLKSATEDLASANQNLIDKYTPLESQLRALQKEEKRLIALTRASAIELAFYGRTAEEVEIALAALQAAIAGVNEELEDACPKAEEAEDCLSEAAKTMETEWVRATENVTDALADFFREGLDGFEDFAEAVEDVIKDMVANILSAIVTSGIRNAITSLVSGGTGGSGSNLFGSGGIGNVFTSIFGSAGAGIALPAINAGGAAFVGPPVALANAGVVGSAAGATTAGVGATGAIGGGGFAGVGAAFANLQSINAVNVAGSGVGASAGSVLGAGLLGVGVGTFLGTKFGGGEIESGIGAVIGAIVGSIVPGLGTFLGGVIGGILGGVFLGGAEKILRSGINIGVSGGEIEGTSFQDIRKRGGLFHRDKNFTKTQPLNAEFLNNLNTGLTEALEAISEVGARLGENVDFSGFSIEEQTLRLSGLSEEQVAAKIQAFLNKAIGEGLQFFLDESENLTDVFKMTVERFKNSTAEFLQVFETMVNLDIALAIDPIQQINDFIIAGSKTLTDVMNEQFESVMALSMAYDGSQEGLDGILEGVNLLKAAQVELVFALEATRLASENLFKDTFKLIEESILTDEEIYGRRQDELDEIKVQIEATTDPIELAALSTQANAILRDAFGLLDELQREELVPGFLEAITAISELIDSQIDSGVGNIESQGTELQEQITFDLRRAADAILEAAELLAEALERAYANPANWDWSGAGTYDTGYYGPIYTGPSTAEELGL